MYNNFTLFICPTASYLQKFGATVYYYPMKHFLLSSIVLFTVLSMVSCSGSKAYYKKGKKLEEAGLNYEAAHFYITSLQRNRGNSDAVLALKRSGQIVLDDLFSDFYKYYANDNYKQAVYAYLEASKFETAVEDVNVRLSSAAYYEDYYNEVKAVYIQQLYNKAQKDLDNENFADAEDKLEEIKTLEPSYKNVSELSNFAFVEPRYRLAIKAYDNNEFRKAYFTFEEIIETSGNYKESKELMSISKENARYTIGVLRFENKSNVRGIESAISGSIVRDLMSFNDPFLVVIDRSNTQQLISEQKLGMTGIIDQSSAAKAGALLGAKAILVGKIISAKKEKGRLIKQSKTGYLGKPVTKVNSETGQKYTSMIYSKVYYYTFKQKNTVSFTFQYQLVSAETGEILISDMIEETSTDEIAYSTFNGDTKYLYKGTWNSISKKNANDKVYNSYSAKREIDAEFKARKDIRSVENISNELFKKISSQAAIKIKNYNPEG